MTAGLLLMANGRAGSAAEDRIEEVVRELQACGADVEVAVTSDVHELRDVLGRRGTRAVVVAGGDGSVHAVANALGVEALRQTVVGVVPMGTGNDLAGCLGLPDGPGEAARVALTGEALRLDLVAVEPDRLMVNAGHAGLGAAAARRSAGLKRVAGVAAYPLGAVIAAVVEPGWEVEVDVDGRRVHAGPVLMVGIGNGPTIGGGARLMPDADPADGLLDVVIVTAIGAGARIGFAEALRDGRHLERDDVVVHRGREVRIVGPPVPHDIDGEVLDPREDTTYRVLPGAWTVRVPPPGNGTAG